MTQNGGLNMLNDKERKFISEIETVSTSLAIWVQHQINSNGWTINDCKIHLLNAAKIAERE